MSSLFEDLKQGLQEAIAFEQGRMEAKTTTIRILSESGKRKGQTFSQLCDKGEKPFDRK